MGSTMVQLITECTQRTGHSDPFTVAGNNSQDVVQLLALMNASGYELLRRADWRELTKPTHVLHRSHDRDGFVGR
jgi:hypothetical protein